MTEEKPYREGDDEDPKPVEPEAPPLPVPSTAFLVLAYPDGRTEVATKMPDLKMDHAASVREIRDIAHSLYCDLTVQLSAKASARELLRVMTEAQERISTARTMPTDPRLAKALMEAHRTGHIKAVPGKE